MQAQYSFLQYFKIHLITGTLLPGGRTVHYKLKVPIRLEEDVSKCSIKEHSPTADLIRTASVMVIDEVTMGSKLMFEVK